MPEDIKDRDARSAEPLPPDDTAPQPTPAEGETAPAEGETAPAEGEKTPAEGDKAPAEGDKKKKKKEKEKLTPRGICYTWLQAMSMALLILLVIFTFFGRIISVEGSSMVPTLVDGDMMFVRCLGYEPEQGDIVVLRKDFGSIHSPIVKRVIAVGGQTVEIDYDTSTVYVDGVALDEPYRNDPHMERPDGADEQRTYWEVPEGSIFVMGDNRNASTDSRNDALGVVDTRYVIGEVMGVILPPQDARFVD